MPEGKRKGAGEHEFNLGTCRIEKDVRFSLTERVEGACAVGDVVTFALACHYSEQTRDRELVRVVVTSDLRGARAVLYDFQDRPGMHDRLNLHLQHRFVASEAGTVHATLKVTAECVRQPWNSLDVISWDLAERIVPVRLRVS